MNIGFPARWEMLKAFPEWLDARLESIGVSRKKALEYLVMFAVLCPVYYVYLLKGWKQATCRPEVHFTFWMIFKFFALTSGPFAVMAAYDGSWRSKDAGNVFLAAYVAGNVLWIHHTGCGFCAISAVLLIIPYIFCAWIAHGIGAWWHSMRRGNQ